MLQDRYLLLAFFLGSFILTYIIIPKIISVVRYKQLMDHPNQRSSHTEIVPSLGGFSFYIVIVLGLYILERLGWDTNNLSMGLIPGLLILFIVGLKDDLVVVSPRTKVGAQLLAIAFVLSHPVYYISDLNFFLGVESISIYFYIPFVAFFMILIINAINLIDGIDGLASIVGIIIFAVYGWIFYCMGLRNSLAICVIMVGCLLAFLRFNLSNTRRIFMGDTGSLIIGFMVASASVRLVSLPIDRIAELPFRIANFPLIIVSILIVPLFDTARVFTIRLLNKKGPFSPDRNHIHHLLIDHLRYSHRKASILIGLFNIIFVLIFMILGKYLNYMALVGVMLLFVSLFAYIFYKIKLLNSTNS